jgi:hypothetical protein
MQIVSRGTIKEIWPCTIKSRLRQYRWIGPQSTFVSGERSRSPDFGVGGARVFRVEHKEAVHANVFKIPELVGGGVDAPCG